MGFRLAKQDKILTQTTRSQILLHSRLVHENIIRYHGHRKEEGIEYIFLEYATGGELFDRIG